MSLPVFRSAPFSKYNDFWSQTDVIYSIFKNQSHSKEFSALKIVTLLQMGKYGHFYPFIWRLCSLSVAGSYVVASYKEWYANYFYG